MNKVNELLGKYWHTLLALGVLALVIYLIYYYGKKAGSGNPVVVSDQGTILNPTQAQTDLANSIATRIHDDLNSGLFGLDPFGTLGRDAAAYDAFAAMSDTMFAYTYARYRALFGSSIIGDIKAESSISGATTVNLIEDKANRLNLS